MQMNPAKRRLNGPARTLMTSLARRLCGAFDRFFKKNSYLFFIYIYYYARSSKNTYTHTRTHTYNLIHCHSLLIDNTTHRPTLGSIRSWGMTKIRSTTKLYKTLLYSIYLFIYLFIIRIFKTFRPAGCTKCKRTLARCGCKEVIYSMNRIYNLLVWLALAGCGGHHSEPGQFWVAGATRRTRQSTDPTAHRRSTHVSPLLYSTLSRIKNKFLISDHNFGKHRPIYTQFF